MRYKRTIARLLLVISMLMLVIPVMPHHHHTDGLLCMKNDLTADGCISDSHNCSATAEECTSAAHPSTHHHCCCNTNCISSHFIQKMPVSDPCDFKPTYLWSNILYYEPVFRLLLLPEEKKQEYITVYVESLHSVSANATCGLRAPPRLLTSCQALACKA